MILAIKIYISLVLLFDIILDASLLFEDSYSLHNESILATMIFHCIAIILMWGFL